MTFFSDSGDTMNDSTEEKLPNVSEKIVELADGSTKPPMLNYRQPEFKEGMWIPEYVKWLAFVCLTIFLGMILMMPHRVNLFPAMRTRSIADIAGMKTAVEMFKEQNNRFPTTAEGLQAMISNPGNLDHWEKNLDTNAIPTDPWGHAYIYRSPGKNGAAFDLLSAGPDGKEGTADDISK